MGNLRYLAIGVKMKNVIFILLILIISIYITAQEFQIDKLGEIAYAQEFRSPEAVQIIYNNLFFLNLNGLEIYEISGDGSLTKLSMLTIETPRNMLIDGQYCFISGSGYDSPFNIQGYHIKIYKIDISDIFNPVIVDQIEYLEQYSYIGLFRLGNYLVVEWLVYNGGTPTDIYYDFYSLPDMDFIGQVLTYNFHDTINDSLLVKQDGYILTTIQYNPPNEFEIIGITDVSAYSDGNYAYDHYKVINDTILSAVNYKNITFWDINDITNWQYLSRYTLPENTGMLGNKQYSIVDENIVIFDPYLIRLLDISDISNPVLVDSLDHNMFIWGQSCDDLETNLYVGTVNDGIQQYRIENNIVEYNYSYYDHKSFYLGDMFNCKIIAGIVIDGYYLFDVEDPLNPVDQGEWFSGKYYRLIHKQGCWMTLKDYEEFIYKIYDITDLDNPLQRNTISLNYIDFAWSFCFIDKFDIDSFYLYNLQTNIFRKFDISNPGEAGVLFEYVLPAIPEGITIINSIVYLTIGTIPYDLLMIGGLEENEPFIANEINNFTNNHYLGDQNGYLVTSGTTYDVGQVFQLDNPLQPELYFTPQWGERIEIENNLIFAELNHIVGVYENNPNCTEPIAIFNGLNYIYNIELMEHNGTNYLITIEMGNIGLFEYTYIPSFAEDELPKPEIMLSNYPNPFNSETTISFSVTQNSDFVSLEIFNVKGQKVRTFIVTLSPESSLGKGLDNNYIGTPSPSTTLRTTQAGSKQYSVIWDGTDSNNKPVSSGVYMYQLKINGKPIASKKCLLLK